MPSPKPLDPEETKAEEHVTELMGPAQPLDGSKPQVPLVTLDTPAASEEIPVQADDLEKTEVQKSIDDFNEELRAKLASAEPTEKDLDLTEPPTDFIASGTADAEPSLDAVVEQIQHSEADTVLAATEKAAVVMKPSLLEKAKNAWHKWWDNPWKRYGTLGLLLVIVLLCMFVQNLRALALNTVGVRSSLQVNVFDGATNLPLQNAIVTAGSATGKTNTEGKVRLKGVKLGKQEVVIHKSAFASTKKQVVFGARIVNLGDITLRPVGTRLTYVFTDYLSGKPIADVEVSSGESVTKSQKTGTAILTVPAQVEAETVRVMKKGYRTEEIKRPQNAKATIAQKLVPATQAVYISKASGKYDVYKTYIDGAGKGVLLPGTGLENQSIMVLPSPDGAKVAVASTRDEKRNSAGYLLTALTLVDVATGEQTNLEYAESINLVGWRDQTLVYLQTVAGASAANPSRQKIIAYDLANNKRYQLAAANYFTGQELVGDTLYYLVSATDPSTQEAFSRIKLDGSNKKALFTGNVWSFLRTGYTTIKLQTPEKWYEYTIGAAAPTETKPSEYSEFRRYVDAPDVKTSVWVDMRDQKGVLVKRMIAAGTETDLTTQKNMLAPLYWLNNTTVVYRVSGAAEVADYVVNIDGGQPKKIADVSLTGVR